MAHKPGSRKGQVHEVFDKEGPEAAVTLGTKIGLALGTLRSWFNAWAKGSGAEVKLPKPPKTERAPRPGKVFAGRRVYDTSDKTKHPGTVVEEGPQVSTVRWDSGHPIYITREEYHISNKYLRDIK